MERNLTSTFLQTVEVFKTNVQGAEQAGMLVEMLLAYFPNSDINFDLEDCDKILRVKHHDDAAMEIPPLLNSQGFYCEELKD